MKKTVLQSLFTDADTMIASMNKSAAGKERLTKGVCAEAAVLALLLVAEPLLESVLQPFGGTKPYDLVVDTGIKNGKRFYTLQIKTGFVKDGVFVFKTADNKGNSYRGRVDWIAAYENQSKQLFLVPPEEIGKRNGYLRLVPPKSKQKKKIRYAVDYQYEKVLTDLWWED